MANYGEKIYYVAYYEYGEFALALFDNEAAMIETKNALEKTGFVVLGSGYEYLNSDAL